VAQHARVIHLGYRVGRLEEKRDLLAENNRQLLCEISNLSHPARIAGEVARMKLALLDPVELSKSSGSDGAEEHARKPQTPHR